MSEDLNENRITTLEAKIDALGDAFKSSSTAISNFTARMEFLRESVKDLCEEGIRSNIEKLEFKEGDVVLFTVPDDLNYDEGFFQQILPIFQEKNVSVIVLHKGITVDIVRKEQWEETSKKI